MARTRRVRQNILGICCEHSRLSLTWMVDEKVRKSVYVDVPDNIADGSRILSRHLFAEFIRDTIKANKINCKNVAFSLPYDDTFMQIVTLPEMDHEQLRLNIPFEFRDFINGELSDYSFAFTRIKVDKPLDDFEQEDNGPKNMTVVATAVEKKYLEDTVDMISEAGLKLVYASTEVVSFRRIGCMTNFSEDDTSEHCFMDIGRDRTRMFIFKEKHFKLMHGVDIGERRIIQTIADEFAVDEHLAQTYYETNYEDCWNLPAVVNIYKDISLEILKAINFYEVSDFTARLSDIVLSGGGSIITPLVNLLKERINMNVVTIGEVFPEWDVNSDGKIGITAPSIGVCLASYQEESLPMNLLHVEKEKVDRRYAIPAVAAILIGSIAFGKFAVYDRFATVAEYNAKVSALHSQIAADKLTIEQNSGLTEQYHHYTTSGMTAEELDRFSRVDIAELIGTISSSDTVVHSYSLTENQIVVDLTAPSLHMLSSISNRLEDNDMVQTCVVQMAQSGSGANQGTVVASSSGVRAQLVIYLDSASTAEGEEDKGS